MGGTDKHYFYGCSLLVASAADGPITGFVVGSASTEGRWLLDALLTWRVTPEGIPCTVDDLPPTHAKGGGRVGPTGPRWWPGSAGAMATGLYVADEGVTGTHWHRIWRQNDGAIVLTSAAYDPGTPRSVRRTFCRWRQRIETVNGLLADVFHLAFPQAKTAWGVVTRIAAKCAALNIGIWLNRLLGRPDLAVDTLFTG